MPTKEKRTEAELTALIMEKIREHPEWRDVAANTLQAIRRVRIGRASEREGRHVCRRREPGIMGADWDADARPDPRTLTRDGRRGARRP
jgi:hypothetical protein